MNVAALAILERAPMLDRTEQHQQGFDGRGRLSVIPGARLRQHAARGAAPRVQQWLFAPTERDLRLSPAGRSHATVEVEGR
jgi:hypothetical protein